MLSRYQRDRVVLGRTRPRPSCHRCWRRRSGRHRPPSSSGTYHGVSYRNGPILPVFCLLHDTGPMHFCSSRLRWPSRKTSSLSVAGRGPAIPGAAVAPQSRTRGLCCRSSCCGCCSSSSSTRRVAAGVLAPSRTSPVAAPPPPPGPRTAGHLCTAGRTSHLAVACP